MNAGMNAGIGQSARRWLLVLVAAIVLAILVALAPMVLDQVAGTSLTSTTYACSTSGGTCPPF